MRIDYVLGTKAPAASRVPQHRCAVQGPIPLPDLITPDGHTYRTLPEATPPFPGADGKPPADRKPRNTTFTMVLLAKA